MNPRRKRGTLAKLVGPGLAAALAVGALSEGCRTTSADAGFRADVAAAPALAPPAVDVSRPLVWRVRAQLPSELPEACDLVSTPEGLVVVASKHALEEDGAALFRLGENRSLVQILAWDGQGFLRAHAYGHRLVVPDADAPFHPLSFAFSWDVDEYVFVSGPDGQLGRDAREVLPRAYHSFDLARLPTGQLVASTGAYPPEDTAYFSKRAAAALFIDDGPGRPWRRALEYPSHDSVGITRLTYLEALENGDVLAGVSSSVMLPEAVRISGLPGPATVTPIAGISGATLRWARSGALVFHLAGFDDGARLTRSTNGGQSFSLLAEGDLAGIVAVEGGLVALVDGALAFSSDGREFRTLTPPNEALHYFPSTLLNAPLAIHEGHVWAASPLTGEIFEAVPEEATAAPAPK